MEIVNFASLPILDDGGGVKPIRVAVVSLKSARKICCKKWLGC
jgi:hypothetical protein